MLSARRSSGAILARRSKKNGPRIGAGDAAQKTNFGSSSGAPKNQRAARRKSR